MTTKRRDNHSTEFGLWLREQNEIDSKYGYLATNIDYMWKNYKTLQWMLIEEKRYYAKVRPWQQNMFYTISKSIVDSNYYGFHILQFEKTSPEDGRIYLNYQEITKIQLVEFLKFNYFNNN